MLSERNIKLIIMNTCPVAACAWFAIQLSTDTKICNLYENYLNKCVTLLLTSEGPALMPRFNAS